jgi:hypothetical protein
MSIPQLLTTEDVATALKRSVSCIEKWRADGVGPNFIKLEGSIFYLEEDVIAYLRGARQLQDPTAPASPQAMRAAALHGLKEVGAAHKARVKEMQDLDRQTTTEPDPYAVTCGVVGSTPGESIQRIINIPPTDVIAQPAPHILQNR